MEHLRVIFLLFALAGINMMAAADELADRMKLWNERAMLCPAPAGAVYQSFPTKQTGESQPCDDGDMTLFNGLLCMAGDERGCKGVADAQDPVSGQWHRSPRLRALGYNDRGDAGFSPDMALGVQLYLVKTRDVARAQKWLTWLHEKTACSIELSGKCLVYALPRFCTDGKGQACTIRPGDAAALAGTVNFLQKNAGLADLPDGRLRGYLGTVSGWGPFIAMMDSMLNKDGFSQHLTGVGISLYRMIGNTDPRLQEAAQRLAEKNPRNAFFVYLNEGKSANALKITLEKCPKSDTVLTPPLYQWQWERDENETIPAWKQTCYWDCIFMGRLLQP